MTSSMGVYLGENLWRSMACGEESFTKLSELYSFSAVPLDDPDSTMEDFLLAFSRDSQPDSEALAVTTHRELVSWFEKDWLNLSEADQLIAGGFEDFPSIAVGGLIPPYRSLLTLLIFHPHRVHSNWVKRLWTDTLAAHEGDSLGAEVELLFLCEQGQNDQRFTVPKPQETHSIS
jgi:hypothetical protein